jgi:hypothetical protein
LRLPPKTSKKKTPQEKALQSDSISSSIFSSIATTDVNSVIQIFNLGVKRMLGKSAAEVVYKMPSADLSDAREFVLRANSLSQVHEMAITSGIEALVFNAARGIEDNYVLTYIRKDGKRFLNGNKNTGFTLIES